MRPNAAAPAGSGFTPEQERTLSKVLWKIVPFLLLCYVFAYLDRVNVGVASLTMNKDLGLTPSQFGWSAGLFFFGYSLAEVPSNLMLQKVGARMDRPHPHHLGPALRRHRLRRRPGLLRRHALPARPR